MRTKYLLAAIFCSVLVLVSGCRTSPVYDVEKHGYATSKADYTNEDVKKAIQRAGSGLGWIISFDEPGHAVGTLYLRDHMAKVDILYDMEGYSITYKDSSNLDYDASDTPAIIHSNYNGWVQNLDNAIRTQLGTL
jgi:hypothetical protein